VRLRCCRKARACLTTETVYADAEVLQEGMCLPAKQMLLLRAYKGA
jgi:hypothetical protein